MGIQAIRRTQNALTAPVQHMGINLGGLDALVAEQLLNGADVISLLDKMGGERMAQGVAADFFVDTCLVCGRGNGALDRPVVYMVAAADARARIDREFPGGEQPLPSPGDTCARIFARQRPGEVDAFDAVLPIGTEKGLDLHQMFFKEGFDT